MKKKLIKMLLVGFAVIQLCTPVTVRADWNAVDEYAELIDNWYRSEGLNPEWFSYGGKYADAIMNGMTIDEIKAAEGITQAPADNTQQAAPAEEPKQEAPKECSHDYKSEITKEPTCTEEGTLTYTCTKCNKSYTEVIEKTVHDYKSTVLKEASCMEEGEVETVCRICGEKETRVVDKLPHEGGRWIVKVEPTCTEKGVRHNHCEKCLEVIEKEDIEPLGHGEEVQEVVQEATMFHKGLEVKKCLVCGEVFEETELPINTLGWLFTGAGVCILIIVGCIVSSIIEKKKRIKRRGC